MGRSHRRMALPFRSRVLVWCVAPSDWLPSRFALFVILGLLDSLHAFWLVALAVCRCSLLGLRYTGVDTFIPGACVAL